MDLIDNIRQLAQRAIRVRASISTEEATKMSLIVPFFQLLGYDVFNPDEFLPEFTADVGIKRGEKVDYAIHINGKPTILIECKWCNAPLDKHDSQLFRYFATTTAKFAILTNGIIYKFYTDLDEANKMDLTPFLELDLENIKEGVVAEVKKFHKDNFDADSMINAASELKYTRSIKSYFDERLRSPSDDFVRFFTQQVYDGVRTQSVIERFTPIVKKALNDYISEKMSDRIKTALNVDVAAQVEAQKAEDATSLEQAEEATSRIETTQEEIEAFYIIKSILIEALPPERLSYKDTESYFSVVADGMVTRWICRMRLDGQRRCIMIPGEDKFVQKIFIESINDLYFHKDLLMKSAQRFSK